MHAPSPLRREGWGEGPGLGQSLQNDLKHAFSVRQYFIVPETQHAVALFLELSCSRFVINQPIAMLSAVELHDQASVRTDKIDDIQPDLVLTAELPALQPAISQVMPEQLLGVCLADAQAACSVYIQTLHP